ncbi:uncharacterized protein BXZ73DRAFT_46384 [Epithele typhae]|uniref:uncharacterized protein n=1 Tax=Epithele typhae TaxID=378194 RepID=UPI00200841E0|nr:uncharacterized protein BXZ73DRAFT_46384 [Epithele typhae]KAH9933166.1 hypothetical protein BXZ73DRAFT_46384 [Epithele typhae]
MTIPLPSAQSLAHRAQLAVRISQLRPTPFKHPLTRYDSHRIPTLWTLYRGILRDSPTETIRSRMRAFFRVRKNVKAQGEVLRSLRTAHKWWDIFKQANAGDAHYQKVCDRYSRMLGGAHMQRWVDMVYDTEMAHLREKAKPQPIITGGFMLPTLAHRALPRLSPQPIHITGMIVSRLKARPRRMAESEAYGETMRLLKTEAEFEKMLAQEVRGDNASFEPCFDGNASDWCAPLVAARVALSAALERDHARTNSGVPAALVALVRGARRERVRNQTAQRARERRGEMTARLARQMRQGPPATVLRGMSEADRRRERIARGAGEAGYTAQVKLALGHKLRDDETWRLEFGQPENLERLEEVGRAVYEENERRSREEGGVDGVSLA